MDQGDLDEWRREWGQFLQNIATLFQQILDVRPYTLPSDGARNLLHNILGYLRPEELEGSIRDVENAIGSLLLEEIRLFNQSVSSDEEPRSPELLNFRLEQVETIKESIEEHITLPERVKKVLSILNELLSLVKV
jgi:hypothetical protein